MPRKKPAETTSKAVARPRRKPAGKAPAAAVLAYQFKIALDRIAPSIWRRIQVADCTLAKLHEYIQAAFGWWNYHLHAFEIGGKSYGPPEPEGMDFGLEMADESEVRLSMLIKPTTKRATWAYEYDFGDGWGHTIRLEKIVPVPLKQCDPVCIAGARACPPEDCGGPWGYADYLAAIADKKHPEHREMLKWGGKFDPEAFDVDKATRAMLKVRKR